MWHINVVIGRGGPKLATGVASNPDHFSTFPLFTFHFSTFHTTFRIVFKVHGRTDFLVFFFFLDPESDGLNGILTLARFPYFATFASGGGGGFGTTPPPRAIGP